MAKDTNVLEEKKIDIRNWVGIVFFRWQILALCFLYSLLAGILYLQVAATIYRTGCRLRIARDPSLELGRAQRPTEVLHVHAVQLCSPRLARLVGRSLAEAWLPSMGSNIELELETQMVRFSANTMLDVWVEGPNADYNEAFLARLLELYQEERNAEQQQQSGAATRVLDEELSRLADRMQSAEEEMIDYQRRNNMAYVEAKGSIEARYLQALMQRRNELRTEQMLLEVQYPMLADASAAVISDIQQLTLESGAVSPFQIVGGGVGGIEGEAGPADGGRRGEDERLVMHRSTQRGQLSDDIGWQALRVELLQLRKLEEEQAKTFLPGHPQLVETRKRISDIEGRLKIAAEVGLERLRHRKEALIMQQNALEAAEGRWQATALLASRKQAEFKRLNMVLDRFQKMYQNLYSRLQGVRVSEQLKAERISVVEPIRTEEDPVWPSTWKIMLLTIVFGLGSGAAFVVLIQVFDDRVHTVSDVELELDLPFLGGVPLWVRKGLGRHVRPIVTENSAAGAIEAYRALRTRLVSALEKEGRKIAILASADAKEGKTLTSLNLAVMMGQMGQRILLVDMDLRRGRLHDALGLTRVPGMTDVLTKHFPLSKVIHRTRFGNLWLVPAGRAVPNTPELLQVAGLKSLFAEVESDYDYIIVDTAPILRVTDTVILASTGLGGVILIAAANRTPKPVVRYTLGLLQEAPVVGLVLNAIDMHRISSLYYAYHYPNYAYYSNAYSYGYTYGDGPPRLGALGRLLRWRSFLGRAVWQRDSTEGRE